MKSRTTTPELFDSAHRHLHLYAIAAVVAVVEIIALAQPLEAKIVYTPTNIKVGFNAYDLDLNHDGLTDFSLYETQYIAHYCQQGDLTEDWLRESATQRNSVVVSSSSYAAALEKGIVIGSNQSFVSDWRDLAFVEGGLIRGQTRCVYLKKLEGDWANVSNRYLGMEFLIKGKIHYGWARLSVQVGYVYINATLTGYAYETIAGKSIKAGQRKEAADDPIDDDFLGADASAMNLFESESQPRSVMPSPLNSGNEYLDRKDSNDSGIRRRNCSPTIRPG